MYYIVFVGKMKAKSFSLASVEFEYSRRLKIGPLRKRRPEIRLYFSYPHKLIGTSSITLLLNSREKEKLSWINIRSIAFGVLHLESIGGYLVFKIDREISPNENCVLLGIIWMFELADHIF